MASRKAEKERLRQQRLERERALAAAARRRRMFQVYGTGAVAVLAAIVIVVVVLVSGGSGASKGNSTNRNHASHAVVKTTSNAGLNLKPAPSAGPQGPEGIPVPPRATALASNASSAKGGAVDGIKCDAGGTVLYHVHTHVTIFVNGAAREVPYGIGIVSPQVQQTAQGPYAGSGRCFYWLHTHASDGIIHIESPVVRAYTLGNFFDLWGQPLGPDQVGPAKGKVTAFYNGKRYTANPRDIPLGNHVQIQLDVDTPLIAPQKVSFAGSGL